MQGTNDSLWNNNTAKVFPPGYFLICGDRTWAGVPRNAFGGPCYIGKLTLLTVAHRNWINITHTLSRTKRSVHQLSASCNDNVELWSATANAFASLIPGIGTAQALKQLTKLACWSIKQANATTAILYEMEQDMASMRHAVLQNRAAIDFLLLAQGHGCEDVDSMCCFNLSDHSISIQKQLQWLKDHTKKITVENNPFDNWLQTLFGSLLPWLLSVIKECLRWCGMIVLIIIIVKIAYHCILHNVLPKTNTVLLVQKEKGGIVGEWLKEGGHGSMERLCESRMFGLDISEP
ncbi:syncytin-A-like [Falco naumanni]|uniref:syncytin-A-like n=1 Tax=Falco naumanni TaxID=148594 RepID=UPI001ADDF7D3|nr:syncytin-A-like [Falco naumanni]